MRAAVFDHVHLAAKSAAIALGIWLAAALPAFSAQMKDIQFSNQGTYTRVVMSLSGPAKDLVVEDNLGKPMTVSFAGSIAGKKTDLRTFSWPNLSQVYYEERNGKVQMFIKRNVVGTVSVDNRADSVVINIPHYYYKAAGSNEIAPGVRYTKFTQHSAQGPVVINVLEVDPRHPDIEVMPALASGRMGAKSNVASMVAAHQAVAGINGSFFKQDKGIPLGILIINQELVSGPIYDRVALGITSTNELVMDRIQLAGEVVGPQGLKLRLHNINQPRTNPYHAVVYSSRWGGKAPGVPANGMQVQIRNRRVTAVSTSESLPIPSDGYVISGPLTTEMNRLASLQSRDERVDLNVYTLPDWSQMKHAIGGGPYLVRHGRPYIDMQAQHFTSRSLGHREPRSAAGITQNGKLLLVTVDGRQKGVSVGMTLSELAYLMQKLGAVDAMNLDGGSSTQMAVYGRMINSPSEGRVGVSNSLIVRRTGGGNMALQNP